MSNVSRELSGGLAEPDFLLECIRFLARSWRKADSVSVLTAGLPLRGGVLTPDLVSAALVRIGVSVAKAAQRPDELQSYEFPAIVFPSGRPAIVLLGRVGQTKYRVFDPVVGAESNIDGRDLRADKRQDALLLAPNFDAVQEESGRRQSSAGHWFWSVLRGHWRSGWYVLLSAAFINVFSLVFPLFTMNVYDRILPNASEASLWVLAIGVAVVVVFDGLLKLARAGVIEHVGRGIDFRLSSGLFERVLNSPMSARPPSTGAFVSKIGQYEVLRDFIAASTLVAFVDAFFLGLFAYIIALLVGWLVVFPLIAGVISVFATIVVARLSRSAINSALKESSARNSVLVEALTGAQSVKASRAEGQFLRRWETAVLASSHTQDQIRGLQSVASNLISALAQLSLIGIIVGGTNQFVQGDATTGAIVAAMMLSNRLIAPIATIAMTLMRVGGAAEAYRTVDGIMKMPDERPLRSGQVHRVVGAGKISFNRVRFAYPDTRAVVLDGISFSISPGEKVGIIGRIGSGKTTIGRLLVNFYQATEGEILLDGVDIRQYHPEDLRRGIGLVVQDPEIFNGTVHDNILMSDPSAGTERLKRAAERAGVEDFVSRHPLGYEMPVGERGILLSGGQRQAIALARAFLVEPKVLFLDEPSSSMDLATERELINNLQTSLTSEQTVLISTHRFSLLTLVSRLLVIENGKLIADGPKDMVLAQLRSRGDGS